MGTWAVEASLRPSAPILTLSLSRRPSDQNPKRRQSSQGTGSQLSLTIPIVASRLHLLDLGLDISHELVVLTQHTLTIGAWRLTF